MKFIKQAKTGSASSGPLWFPLNTTSSLAVKGSIGATLDSTASVVHPGTNRAFHGNGACRVQREPQ